LLWRRQVAEAARRAADELAPEDDPELRPLHAALKSLEARLADQVRPPELRSARIAACETNMTVFALAGLTLRQCGSGSEHRKHTLGVALRVGAMGAHDPQVRASLRGACREFRTTGVRAPPISVMYLDGESA